MRLFALGLSHWSSPLEMRESIAFTRDELPHALRSLSATLDDVVIVSTCNRTEIYSTGQDDGMVREALTGYLAQRLPQGRDDLSRSLYFYTQEDAVRHLFRVASGLDSLILGESQVLGQVREAYSASVAQGCARGVISKVFHHAMRVGRRVRRETRIGENALSVSSAAVEMARHTLGPISGRSVAVIGAGQAGKLVAKALKDRGVDRMVMVNRTLKRAQDLAESLGADASALEDLEDILGTVDIVVSSTDSQSVVLSREMVERGLAHEKRRASPHSGHRHTQRRRPGRGRPGRGNTPGH